MAKSPPGTILSLILISTLALAVRPSDVTAAGASASGAATGVAASADAPSSRTSAGATASAPSVVSQADLDHALAESNAAQEADREAIRSLLSQPQVRGIAAAYGLDVKRAEAAARVLSGPELQRLASQARQLDSRLSGGSRIVMDETTLIIILLLIIILILALR